MLTSRRILFLTTAVILQGIMANVIQHQNPQGKAPVYVPTATENKSGVDTVLLPHPTSAPGQPFVAGTTLPAPPMSFYVCRTPPGLLALTLAGGVFTSTISNTFFPLSSTMPLPVLFLSQSEADRDLVLAVTAEGDMWALHKCASEVKKSQGFRQGDKVREIKWHSAVPEKVLILTKVECSDLSAVGTTESAKCVPHTRLYLSEDGGLNVREIKSYVYQFDWLKHADFGLDSGNFAIVVTQSEDKDLPMGGTAPKHPQGVSTTFSWDFFKTQTRIVHGGYRYWLSKCCLFVETSDKKGNRFLHMTEVWQNAFHWLQVTFEGDGLSSNTYSDYSFVADLKSSTPFIIGHRVTESGLQIGDLFVADHTKSLFRQLLSHIVIEASNSRPAIQASAAMDGLIFANIYDESYLRVYSHLKNTRASLGSEISGFTKTVVSHSYGQTFGPVTPPSLTSSEDLYPCSSDASACKLHMNLVGSQTGSPLYSSPSCPGIILASGNVGSYLSDSSEGGSFMSEDGGVHWRELTPGQSVSTLGRECDIVVMIGSRGASPSIAWSFDRVGGGAKNKGQNTGTDKFQYTSIPADLPSTSIQWMKYVGGYWYSPADSVADPSSKRWIPGRVVMGGNIATDGRGVLLVLDINKQENSVCKGDNSASSSDSDYEKFIPKNERNTDCVNGRNGYFIRKKPTARCHMASNLINFVTVKPCPCTDLDFECDTGYVQTTDSLVCEPIKNFDFSQLIPSNCVETYQKSDGYRKISTTMCQGGVTHNPTTEKCPGKWGFLSSLLHFLTRFILYGAVVLCLFIAGKFIYERFSSESLSRAKAGKPYESVSKEMAASSSTERGKVIDEEFDDDDDL